MFTGIVEEIGTIASVQRSGMAIRMNISAKQVLEDVQNGDSIAVNGICLTVVSYTPSSFTVDVMPETIKATSLQAAKNGSHVNLERAMVSNGRFGGHFVSGHIDGTGTIIAKHHEANAVYYKIEISRHLLRYCIQKGSIAIDGTSLTIFKIDNNSITISLIPHTLNYSVLGHKEVGEIVNIECDLVGKYIERFITKPPENSSITTSFLQDNGFM
ncbi:riboflavin synthase [Ectobacillus polymachus]|uniref:riboflavin synthase n=1 Tax=Ectobacillus polymachus TaxID=1508806 RepID=UPI003A890F27